MYLGIDGTSRGRMPLGRVAAKELKSKTPERFGDIFPGQESFEDSQTDELDALPGFFFFLHFTFLSINYIWEV